MTPIPDAWSLVDETGKVFARIWLEQNPKDPWFGMWVALVFYNRPGFEQGFTGAYSVLNTNFRFPVTCSDGRSGEVFASRRVAATKTYGPAPHDQVFGEIKLSDGTKGVFVLGNDAKRMNSKSLLYADIMTKGIVQVQSPMPKEPTLEKEIKR